jgi:hypothetical protein
MIEREGILITLGVRLEYFGFIMEFTVYFRKKMVFAHHCSLYGTSGTMTRKQTHRIYLG